MLKSMDTLVALCKNRGFIYPGSEIYGGLANTWDYGPLGNELKNNVKAAWRKKFIQEQPNIVGLDAAILMNPETWVASGHVGGFSDPLIDCKECKTRHRADKLIEEWAHENGKDMIADGMTDEELINFIKENKISIYNENTRKGLFRHIVIKIGIRTGQIMCILVVNGENILKEEQLINELITKFPQIKTIVKNVNMKNTNVILGQRNINVYGNGYIEDILGKYTFKISPLSFYQVNPIQAEKLYNLGVEMAQISKDDTVFDLYCGIGTISLFMAKYAKKVYGIEIVKEAIDAAKENAKINNVDNTEFYAGDVEVVLDELINKNKVKADIVMFDPPRKGLDKKSINNILQIKPKKLVYISCNPATLIRDLKMFEEQYEIKTIIPVDMFPWTSHIECVSLLCLKKGLS